MVSIDEGTQIDRSDPQASKADSPRFEIRQPDSNVKRESAAHPLKQELGIVSIDEGMQIDRSELHSSKANSPRLETRQSDANLTDEIERHDRKHPPEMETMSLEILTSLSCPKYQTRQVSERSTTKSPRILKNGLSSSIVTFVIPESAIAMPVKWRTPAGMKSDSRLKQLRNAQSPRLES
jgi:hypothetical protein